MVYVSWQDVQAFLKWLNENVRDDYHYVLPSEAQWERAAPGPAFIEDMENRRLYPWGDDFDETRCNTNETGLNRTTAVGCFINGNSHEGVLDLSGNVWEWCQDKYEKDYYKQGRTEVNEEGEYYLVRGGPFNYYLLIASCVYRHYYHIDFRYFNVGFRVARINKT